MKGFTAARGPVLAFSAPEGLLVVGGEDCDGRARVEVFAIKLSGAVVVVDD